MEEEPLVPVSTETPLVPDVPPENSAAEPLYIDRRERRRTSTRSDDIMMTQCIFCLILALSVFALHWVSPPFQTQLLALYKQQTALPPPPFLQDIITSAEAWFRR